MNKFGLDIIIPTYKNIQGLETTLKSIYCQDVFKWSEQLNFPILITVVDDYSNLDYSQIQKKYPKIVIHFNNENQGPGIARQNGIDSTKLPYITFIDTGDYLLSKYAILQIMLTIKQNLNSFIYSWCYIDEEDYTYHKSRMPLLRGTVYNREFIQSHGINFCPQSSYANEDVGFSRQCDLIITELTGKGDGNITFSDIPIYMYTYDKDSITRKNNYQFIYKKQIPALILNIQHAVKVAQKNNVKKHIIWNLVSYMLVRLYYDFRVSMIMNKEQAQKVWKLIKSYYKNLYCKYQMQDVTRQRKAISNHMRKLIDLGITKINFTRFLEQLETEENIPQYYFKK